MQHECVLGRRRHISTAYGNSGSIFDATELTYFFVVLTRQRHLWLVNDLLSGYCVVTFKKDALDQYY